MTARTSDVRSFLKDALGIVSRRKRLILGIFFIVALGISLVVVSVPTSYEVAGKLVVTRTRGDLLISPASLRYFNFLVTASSIQDMAVHAELLKNRSLIETVVKQLGLDRGGSSSASKPDQEQGRLNGQVDTILNGLAIQVVPNSNLIYVRYRSADPVKGADIVNALLDQYREAYVHMRATPGATQFFEEQRDKLAGSLKESERTLAAFRNKTALAAAAEQVDAYSRRLAEAENDAIDAQYDQKEAERRAAIIKEQLDREPESILFSSTTRYNPMIQAIQGKLLTLEMEEQQLLNLYADTDRRVQDKRTEIEAQKQRLAEARASDRVPDNEMMHRSGRHRDLEVQHIAATLDAQKNAIRAESARTIANEMRERVRALGVANVQKDALVREIEANSDTYLLYGKKTEEARLGAALDDNVIANVAIGERASREGVPVGPPKNLSLVLALAMGLVSGVGGAFLRELFDGPLESERPGSRPTG
jgi:uncharacterized protein involved in exopolysaccharide biosynthesis